MTNFQDLRALAAEVVIMSKQAGQLIMQIYKQPLDIITKDDDSPLTQADLASHHCLVDALRALTPDIPVLSEESTEEEKVGRLSWQTYWLIDPLDGTKEFIKKNGEFTVNVALIENGKATLGVVHAPALDITYWGVNGQGAFKQQAEGEPVAIQVSPNPAASATWKVVGSRSHQSEEFKTFMQTLPNADVVSMGSSLKLCLVAEGAAHLYPRLGLTSEWDTAAAQGVVEAAGGQVLACPDLKPLLYNTRPDTLLNPFFIVCAKPDPVWVQALA